MENSLLVRINLVARYTLAIVFIYHGLIPKILWQSTTEIALVNAHGLDASLMLPVFGVFEVLLGLSIVWFRKSLIPIYLTAMLLAGLLIDVAFVMPHLLAEAFNPVTTNLLSVACLYFIYITHKSEK